MTYSISAAGLALIQDCEGFRAQPTQLPDGNWLVGYGHVRVGEPGAPLTEAEAAQLLVMDVAPVERMVNAHVTARLSQSQFDALVSFAISVGAEAFMHSQVLRRVNNAEHVAAACAMDAWRKSDASGELEVVDALVRRRAAEKALYLRELPVEAAPSVFLRAKLDYAASVLGAPVAFAPAPAVEAAPAIQAKPHIGERLVEILKSEPATEALLLTQVVPDEEIAEAPEIVTAHAKPAARRVEREQAGAPFQPDRRLAKMRARAGRTAFLERITPRLEWSETFAHVGLVALLLFGAGLTLVGGSQLLGGVEDSLQIAAAAAFATPGIAAMLMAGYGLVRKPAHA